MTDYAIARRIVDLHSRNEESVERVYSLEDIQRYITFARQFKPKVSRCLFDSLKLLGSMPWFNFIETSERQSTDWGTGSRIVASFRAEHCIKNNENSLGILCVWVGEGLLLRQIVDRWGASDLSWNGDVQSTCAHYASFLRNSTVDVWMQHLSSLQRYMSGDDRFAGVTDSWVQTLCR